MRNDVLTLFVLWTRYKLYPLERQPQTIIPDLFRNQTLAPWFFPSKELTAKCPAKLMVWKMFRLPLLGLGKRTAYFSGLQPFIVSGFLMFFGLKNTPTSRSGWRKPWVKKILQKAWSTNMSTIFVGESSACTWGDEKTHDVHGVLQLGCFRECRLKLTLTYTMDRYLFLKST